jgi:carboxyl-terminal processing protease
MKSSSLFASLILCALLDVQPICAWTPLAVGTARQKSFQHEAVVRFQDRRSDTLARSRSRLTAARKSSESQYIHKSDRLAASVSSLFVSVLMLLSLPLSASASALSTEYPSWITSRSLHPLQQQQQHTLSRSYREQSLDSVSVLTGESGLNPHIIAWLGQTRIDPSTSTSSSSSLLASIKPAAEDETGQSRQPNEQPQLQQQEYSLLDEVWTLIDKYYIDRSFHNQDWKAVRQKYQAKLAASTTSSSSNEPALVSEMVQSLGDKYSRLLDASAYAQIQKYDLIGVGVTLMPEPISQRIVVGAPPIPGSASADCGLQMGDWVTEVNGRSTVHRNAFDIIDQIAEQPNAPTIDFTVVPRERIPAFDMTAVGIRGSGSPSAAATMSPAIPGQRTVTMNRAFAQVKNPVVYSISERRNDGTKVGYIRISEFNALVKTKLQDAIVDLVQTQGANALVLDIRHNGGGAFQSAVEISSLFLEPGKVATYVVDGSMGRIPFKTAEGQVNVPADLPIAIWLDDKSASASEVFAGSMHDNCRAVLMGDTSYGKGVIQAVYGLKSGGGLVLTVARYVTPDGVDIQGKGIQPDIRGHVSPPIPGFLSDTSGVDFAEIRQRTSPALCKVPDPSA